MSSFATFGKPKVRFNNYGGTVGGPILKQKLFFFANAEAYNYISENPSYTTVATAQEYAGDFSDLGVRNSSGVCTPVKIYDPSTATTTGARTQYLNNRITNLDPVAVAYTRCFTRKRITPAALTTAARMRTSTLTVHAA